MSLPRQPDAGAARKAVLTGPSGGLGSLFLDELCQAGWQVLAISRHADRLAARTGLIPLCADLSCPDAVTVFLRDHAGWLGETDLLINNAGAGVLGALQHQGMAAVNSQMQLMLHTPITLCMAVLPGMQNRDRGCVVNVTSLAGLTGIPFMAPYTSAKAGLTGFTKALQLESSGSGVQILEWCPADIRSDFNNAMRRAGDCDEVWQKLEAYMAKAPHADTLRSAFRQVLSGGSRQLSFYPGRRSQVWAALFAGRLLPRRFLLRCVRRYYGLS